MQQKYILPPLCKLSVKPTVNIKEDRGDHFFVKDIAIIYDFEGGLYPADIMDLAVLLNSD